MAAIRASASDAAKRASRCSARAFRISAVSFCFSTAHSRMVPTWRSRSSCVGSADAPLEAPCESMLSTLMSSARFFAGSMAAIASSVFSPRLLTAADHIPLASSTTWGSAPSGKGSSLAAVAANVLAGSCSPLSPGGPSPARLEAGDWSLLDITCSCRSLDGRAAGGGPAKSSCAKISPSPSCAKIRSLVVVVAVVEVVVIVVVVVVVVVEVEVQVLTSSMRVRALSIWPLKGASAWASLWTKAYRRLRIAFRGPAVEVSSSWNVFCMLVSFVTFSMSLSFARRWVFVSMYCALRCCSEVLWDSTSFLISLSPSCHLSVSCSRSFVTLCSMLMKTPMIMSRLEDSLVVGANGALMGVGASGSGVVPKPGEVTRSRRARIFSSRPTRARLRSARTKVLVTKSSVSCHRRLTVCS
mmetsp:Transcript_40973/g.121492  ORF Transcript_40973/g.121492 Transcript_40973/m.121492 type:complete len:413 (-) Transcript_40973:429-1667(-)